MAIEIGGAAMSFTMDPGRFSGMSDADLAAVMGELSAAVAAVGAVAIGRDRNAPESPLLESARKHLEGRPKPSSKSGKLERETIITFLKAQISDGAPPGTLDTCLRALKNRLENSLAR